MSRIFLLISLLLYYNFSFSDWYYVSETLYGKFYIDFKSIKESKDKNIVMTSLSDFPRPQVSAIGLEFNSEITTHEFQCSRGLYKIIELEAFNARMAKGKSFYHRTRNSDWIEVVPGTTEETFWKIACDKFESNNQLQKHPDFK